MDAATLSAYGRLLLLVWVMGGWERQATIGRGQAALAASIPKSSLPTAEAFVAMQAEKAFGGDGDAQTPASVRPSRRGGRRKETRLAGRSAASVSRSGGGADSTLGDGGHASQEFLPPGGRARRNTSGKGTARLSASIGADEGSRNATGGQHPEPPCRLCRLCIENWVAGSKEGGEPVPHPSSAQCRHAAGSLNGDRICGTCGSSDGIYGVVDDGIPGAEVAELERLWLAFLCSRCSDKTEAGEGETRVKYLQQRCWVCSRQATFAAKGARKRDARHCKLHRVPGEVDVRNKLCSYAGEPECTRRALFGNHLEKSGPLFCSQHKLGEHVDVSHAFCKHSDGCRRRPIFGNAVTGRALHCQKHKTFSDVDVHNARCRHLEGCEIRPCYGELGSKCPTYCKAHKLSHHVRVSRYRRSESVEWT